MARATILVKETVTLELSGEEAGYLQALLQNNLMPEPESAKHYNFRAEIFAAITKVLRVKT